MRDLNTINRLNAEASGASQINDQRRNGKYVVALYAGLDLVSFTTFDHASAAAEAAQAPTDASERRVVFGPITGPTRDQSEDRRQPYTVEELNRLARGEPVDA